MKRFLGNLAVVVLMTGVPNWLFSLFLGVCAFSFIAAVSLVLLHNPANLNAVRLVHEVGCIRKKPDRR